MAADEIGNRILRLFGRDSSVPLGLRDFIGSFCRSAWRAWAIECWLRFAKSRFTGCRSDAASTEDRDGPPTTNARFSKALIHHAVPPASQIPRPAHEAPNEAPATSHNPNAMINNLSI